MFFEFFFLLLTGCNSDGGGGENTSQTNAQVTGRLLDYSGNPVAEASVTISSELITTKTDADGYFVAENLSLGEHQLTITKQELILYKMPVNCIDGDNALGDLSVSLRYVDKSASWYLDKDGDGYSDGTNEKSTLAPGDEYQLASYLKSQEVDCEDSDNSINPDAAEICDGKDNDCDGIVDEDFDSDDDGYTVCNGDCEDSDASINPAADEKCDSQDNNCDGIVDEGFDSDDDGYTVCSGDCNDSETSINPDAPDICGNGIDEDCSGSDAACPPENPYTFEMTYDISTSEYGRDVVETSDGGFLVAGSIFFPEKSDWQMLALRTDNKGEKLWSSSYGGALREEGVSAAACDGGFVLLGKTISFGSGGYDFYLVKIDGDGKELWTQTFGGSRSESPQSVLSLSDGGFLLVGASVQDVYLVRTDSNGEEVWSSTIGENANPAGWLDDEGYAARELANGDFLIIGRTRSHADGDGSYDMYLLRVDSEGRKLWATTYGGETDEGGYALTASSEGYFLLGNVDSNVTGSSDLFMVSVDSKGKDLWSKTIGGTGAEFARTAAATPEGGFAVFAQSSSFAHPKSSMYFLKTDIKGDLQNYETFEGLGTIFSGAMKPTRDGGYVMVGTTATFQNDDILLIKVNKNGHICSGVDCKINWYKDADGDGFSNGEFVNQLDQPEGYFPAKMLISMATDCDDSSSDIHPQAEEVCMNAVDEDCDGLDALCWYKDHDGDKYSDGTLAVLNSRPTGYSLELELAAINGDCNDDDPAINPGMLDVCGNNIDEDCDYNDAECPASWPVWYKDEDSDGFSDGTKLTQIDQPPGFRLIQDLISISGDCNDSDAEVNPAAFEICGNGKDDDCQSGDALCPSVWYKDSDGDGYSDGTTQTAIYKPIGYFAANQLTATEGDCDDDDALANPGVEEICENGKDDNCDGNDAVCPSLWYKDLDGDGWSDGSTLEQVGQPQGHYLPADLAMLCGDCNDDDPDVYRGNSEIAGDGIDNNCNGYADETSGSTFASVWGGCGEESGSTAAVVDDGYVIGGHTDSFGAGARDLLLLKIDLNGNELWWNTFGGAKDDVFKSFVQTSDNAFALTGNFPNEGYADIDLYAIKTDSFGNEAWSMKFGGAKNQFGQSVLEDFDGGFLWLGSSQASGALQPYIVKTDASGKMLWSDELPYPGARNFSMAPDGGFFVWDSNTVGDQSTYSLIKTDSQGVEVWSDAHSFYAWSGKGHISTSDGGFVIFGMTPEKSNLLREISLTKIDSEGLQLWAPQFGNNTARLDAAYKGLLETSDGGFIFIGEIIEPVPGSSHIYAMKIDSEGKQTWCNTYSYNDISHESATAVLETADNGFAILGVVYPEGGLDNNDILLVKIDASGDKLWAKTYGGAGRDSASWMQVLPDGGFLIGGGTGSFGSGSSDIYIIKTDSEGNVCQNAGCARVGGIQ